MSVFASSGSSGADCNPPQRFLAPGGFHEDGQRQRQEEKEEVLQRGGLGDWGGYPTLALLGAM